MSFSITTTPFSRFAEHYCSSNKPPSRTPPGFSPDLIYETNFFFLFFFNSTPVLCIILFFLFVGYFVFFQACAFMGWRIPHDSSTLEGRQFCYTWNDYIPKTNTSCFLHLIHVIFCYSSHCFFPLWMYRDIGSKRSSSPLLLSSKASKHLSEQSNFYNRDANLPVSLEFLNFFFLIIYHFTFYPCRHANRFVLFRILSLFDLFNA